MRNGGHEEQRRFLRSLRQSRAAAFRKEIVPHFRYVFQSGFGLFASLILFSAFVWYIDFIKGVPSNWPADLVGVVVLTLAVIRAPLRTYFRSADSVFLLPMEDRVIQTYIRTALDKAIIAGVLRTLAIFAIFAPIYTRSPVTEDIASGRSMIGMSVLFAFVAGCNVYSGWRERQPASGTWCWALRIVRWLLTMTVVAALLLKPLSWAIPIMLLCIAIIWLLWHIPSKHALPWEKLVEEEAAARRRWMSFLGWFVDVPTEISKPARRVWIAWIGDFLTGQHRWSWHFLYAKTFLRGEIFGAFSRWIVLSGVIIVVTGNKIADAVIYAIAILVVGLQLSELRRVRFVETAATLPIAQEGRLVAAAAIARSAGVAAAILLALAGILTVGLGASGAGRDMNIWFPLLAVGLLWCGWWMPRKIAKFADDDDL
ncbi:ABC transporter permease [Cohnella sp.]|uniref:ABC transporter permease n=1 Tax=Cohnella sp. TaxID=1883426 RepID=UPI00356B1D50